MPNEVAIDVLNEQIAIFHSKIAQAKKDIDDYKEKILHLNHAKAALLVDREPALPATVISRNAGKGSVRYDKLTTSAVKDVLSAFGPRLKQDILDQFKGANREELRKVLNKHLTTILFNQVRTGAIKREGPGDHTDIYSLNSVNNEQ